MTEFLVIDTEGTGLFDYKKPADAPGQPRMASISMIAADADLCVFEEQHLYIKPDGWVMPAETTKINGLTTEFLMKTGVPVIEALEVLQRLMKGRTVVAHNVQHDLKHVRGELRHASLPDNFEETPNLCTMRGLTEVCKIPPHGRRGGYKWPSLSEACVFFGMTNLGDHSAKNDAHACLALLREMKRLGLPIEGKVHFAKEKPAAPYVDLGKSMREMAEPMPPVDERRDAVVNRGHPLTDEDF